MNNRQIINLIGLAIGFATLAFPILTPFWGFLFLTWVWQGFQLGTTQFFFGATREEQPAVFWLTQILWTIFSLMFILEPIFPEYF
jgi:hypothetical protein